ncbi:hypothetical protein C6575_14785 [Nocardia seriolae]|nr:hypothetical protein C6575_14785 [Nocardia seriolae]
MNFASVEPTSLATCLSIAAIARLAMKRTATRVAACAAASAAGAVGGKAHAAIISKARMASDE